MKLPHRTHWERNNLFYSFDTVGVKLQTQLRIKQTFSSVTFSFIPVWLRYCSSLVFNFIHFCCRCETDVNYAEGFRLSWASQTNLFCPRPLLMKQSCTTMFIEGTGQHLSALASWEGDIQSLAVWGGTGRGGDDWYLLYCVVSAHRLQILKKETLVCSLSCCSTFLWMCEQVRSADLSEDSVKVKVRAGLSPLTFKSLMWQ